MTWRNVCRQFVVEAI